MLNISLRDVEILLCAVAGSGLLFAEYKLWKHSALNPLPSSAFFSLLTLFLLLCGLLAPDDKNRSQNLLSCLFPLNPPDTYADGRVLGFPHTGVEGTT